MEFAAYQRRMITDDEIQIYRVGNVPLGYEFKCTYPTYRGAYLSNIQELTVTVDGKEINSADIRFGINGKWFLMSQIKDIFTEYWFTGAKATIRILDNNGIAPGEHTIKMHMVHKIPYTGYFGNYLVLDADCEKTLKVEETKDVISEEPEKIPTRTEGLKYGVCLYSFADYFQSGKLDLEGVIKKAKEIGYTGVTIVASMHCDQYPYPTDEWLENLKMMLKKYEMEPLCWEAYLDMGMRSDRDMTVEEIADFTRNDIIHAYKAGFNLVKTQHSITPEVFESMLPLCKRLGVRLAIELHHPHHPNVPKWRDEYLKIMERSEGWLGVVVDTGIFQKYPSELHIREAYELGCRKEIMEKVLEYRKNGTDISEALKLDLTDIEKEYTHVFYEKFNAPAKVSQMDEIWKLTPLIHGKFYYLDEDSLDPCIPFEEVMPALKRYGFNGYMVAEYEGHHLTDMEDEVVQLNRFFKLVKKLYEEPVSRSAFIPAGKYAKESEAEL